MTSGGAAMPAERDAAGEEPRTGPGQLVDFAVVAGRLPGVAAVAAAVCVIGAVVDGLRVGLSFAVLARWASIFAGLVLLGFVLVVAMSAYRGATAAQRRGERLSAPDVGPMPSRRSRDDA